LGTTSAIARCVSLEAYLLLALEESTAKRSSSKTQSATNGKEVSLGLADL